MTPDRAKEKAQKLKPEQEAQIGSQIEAYEAQKKTSLVAVPFGGSLIGLEVDPKVANPEIMNSGAQVVQFLFAQDPRPHGRDEGRPCRGGDLIPVFQAAGDQFKAVISRTFGNNPGVIFRRAP